MNCSFEKRGTQGKEANKITGPNYLSISQELDGPVNALRKV